MRKPIKALVPLAAAALAVAMSPGPAFADHANGSYQTTLNPLNGSSGSGMAMIEVSGDQGTVTMSWEGLPETFDGGPYPHVQHIHVGAQGTCPTPDADENGDGVVNVVEGTPAYGEIGNTLSTSGDASADAAVNLEVAAPGGSLDYNRTIPLSEATLDSLAEGTAVITVHGLDPTTLSPEAAEAKSEIVPELPLAATSPALCGALSSMPAGGVATGGGDTAGLENTGLLAGGGALLLAGAAGLVMQRRRVDVISND